MDCDVCLEPFDDKDHRPKCLPCGHTFCLRCITQQKDKKCPVDRKPYRPAGNNLPDNFKIIELVQRPGSVCGWCRSCDAEAADSCLDEHPGSLCSLKAARLEDVQPRLEALAQADEALNQLNVMMKAAASDVHTQVQGCISQVERERVEVVGDKGRQQAAMSSDPAAWAMSRSRKRPRQPETAAGQVKVKQEPTQDCVPFQRQRSDPLEDHALARGVVQLLTDLADPTASCVVTVVRGGGTSQSEALWRGTVWPEEDAASRLLLSRMLCQATLRRELPLPMLQIKTEGAAAALAPPPSWLECSNEGEWSVREMQLAMTVGSRVVRGPDWDPRWLDDGEPPGPGTILSVDASSTVFYVAWDHAIVERHRYFMIPGFFRLKLLPNRPEAPLPQGAGDVLDVSNYSTSGSMKKPIPEKMARHKKVLVGLRCDVSSNWSKALLQRLSPHLAALAMVSAQQQHLRQALAMPHLRALHLSGRAVAVDPVVDLTEVGGSAEAAVDSLQYAVDKAPMPKLLRELYIEHASREQVMQVPSLTLLHRLELHCPYDAPLPAMDFTPAVPPAGLLWLRLGIYPLSTALSLIRANAATLKELELVAAAKDPYGCPALPTELQRCGLSALRRLVLWRATVTGAYCRHDAKECIAQKAAMATALAPALVLCSECDKKASVAVPQLVSEAEPLLAEPHARLALVSALLMHACCYGKNIPSYAGPFIVNVERIFACDKPNNKVFVNLTVSHLSPTRPFDVQTITGVTTSFLPLTDDWWSDARMDIRSNNQWKHNAFVFRFPRRTCTTAYEFTPRNYKKLFSFAQGKCALPPMRVDHRDEPIPFSLDKVPVMPYGTYRMSITTGSPDNASQVCFGFLAKLIPRPA